MVSFTSQLAHPDDPNNAILNSRIFIRKLIASVAGHAMYERANPYYEYVAGGMLDMTNCKYEQYDEKTTKVTGPVFVPSNGKIKVKLEGSGKIGEKYIGIAGIRDPYTIKHIDKVIDMAEEQIAKEFKGENYHVHFRVFGKNGVMGDLEPVKEIKSHELCVILEGIADSKEKAEAITLLGIRQIFYTRLPEVKGTAGTAAFVVDDVLYAGGSYAWTLNHVIPVDDPMELFDVHMTTIGNPTSVKVGE